MPPERSRACCITTRMSFTDAVDALASNEAFLWGFVCAAAIVLGIVVMTSKD